MLLSFEHWSLNIELYDMGSWRVDRFTSWQVNCSDKSQLAVVIIIMNCEFWIMNYIGNHNYGLWRTDENLVRIILNCKLKY